DTNPDPGIDVAFVQEGDIEVEPVIGRVARRTPRVEEATARTSDITACAKLTDQRLRHDSGAYGPVLQRRGVVVEFDQCREYGADLADQRRDSRGVVATRVFGDTPWDDTVHHQPMTEADL